MNYKYCPVCGSKLNKVMKDERPRLECPQCKFIFYQNSKPTASALIIKDGKVLLGKRRSEPSKGKWDAIGGFLDLGEHPTDGMKREAREETGLDVEILDMLDFVIDTYGEGGDSTLNITYIAKPVGGLEKPGDDIVMTSESCGGLI